jgi:rhodanese-related sulfurtransferase
MKNWLIIICVLWFVAPGEVFAQDDKVFTVDKLYSVLEKKPENVVLVDVRTLEEYNEGKIAGAINIDVKSDYFSDSIQSLNKKQVYVLYCKSGVRQERAKGIMQEAGFKNIWLLEGGITEWIDEGKEIEEE